MNQMKDPTSPHNRETGKRKGMVEDPLCARLICESARLVGVCLCVTKLCMRERERERIECVCAYVGAHVCERIGVCVCV